MGPMLGFLRFSIDAITSSSISYDDDDDDDLSLSPSFLLMYIYLCLLYMENLESSISGNK